MYNKLIGRLAGFSILFLFGSLTLFAQKHYVVEIDRLTNLRKYTLMDLVNGRPVEKEIGKPILEKNDILTIRLVNFNELIYGLEIKQDLVEKKNVVDRLMQNPFIDQANFSPSVNLLMDILSDPPSGMSRGEESAGVSLASVRKSYVGVLTKIKLLEQRLDIAYDEGASLSEIKRVLNEITEKYNPKEIENDLKGIKKDVGILKLNEQESELLDDITDGVEFLEKNAASGYLAPKYSLRNLKKIFTEVDFIDEQTFVVGQDSDNEEDYDRYLASLYICKRANEITSPDKITKQPYKFSGYSGGEKKGDFIRQTILVDLKMRDSRKLFWTLGIHQVFVPRSIFSYDTEYSDYFEDSLRFIGTRIGGGRLVVGTDLNFPLPFRTEHVLTSFSLGLAMAFSNAPGKKAYELDKSQAFITTGFGFSPAKWSGISLKAGVAWAKFQQLSKQYRTNVWYENTFTDFDLEQSIKRKIRPSFTAGISIRL